MADQADETLRRQGDIAAQDLEIFVLKQKSISIQEHHLHTHLAPASQGCCRLCWGALVQGCGNPHLSSALLSNICVHLKMTC